MEKVQTEIRPIHRSEWDMAMQLCWDTFLVYEAPEYDPEGVKHFNEFVKGDELRNMFAMGEYYAFGAYRDNVIVGVLGIRKHWHISLLFVEPSLHHQGIATALLKRGFFEAKKAGIKELTVYSSPYARDFYHKIGFVDIDNEKTADGIRFTPMKIELS